MKQFGEQITLEERHFEKRVFQAEMFITDECLTSVRDPMRFGQRLSLRGAAWERYLERARVEHPRTWWDAVKLRWAPKWWLKRWPAQMVVVELVATEVLTNLMPPPYQSRHTVTVWPGGML